jgi:putative ABC transport system permease protein
MKYGVLKIVIGSIKFNKKPVIYQIAIIVLLAAVITGSLLTGSSVRSSLKKSASERLGNTGILISSGTRFFDMSLAERMKDSARINSTGLLELDGYCQSLDSQIEAFNTHIYAINDDFFTFHGNSTVVIKPGEVAVNNKLASKLGLKQGDELIIKFNEISDIPADAPFAPSKNSRNSVVLKVGSILESINTGDFSLSISQIRQFNIFVRLPDIEKISGKKGKINRLLIAHNIDYSLSDINSNLANLIKPADIGLKIRSINKTGECELISDRVFVDETIVEEISKILPSATPVLTYMGNKLVLGSHTTPYSFVSALSSTQHREIPKGNGIIINQWLAEDLNAGEGDTIEIFWYSPDIQNKLVESSSQFFVTRIVRLEGVWNDSLLMPDFPGIAGSESCSDWDAGVHVRMDDIRQKDEDYWNKYRGTPKAFIDYETGKRIWGNNFGPATSLRFPAGLSCSEIDKKLCGSFYPDKVGFSVIDISEESVKAANESVDFSTLFLSLGFFLIVASMVLLSFAVSSFFDSKRSQIRTFYALGFNNAWISRLLFLETMIISTFGCVIGAFLGFIVNIVITSALNSVWKGAVQTDTLESFFNFVPVLAGFLITFSGIMLLMGVKINRYLRKLNHSTKDIYITHSLQKNLVLLILLFGISLVFFVLSILFKDKEISFSFTAGSFLLVTFIFFWRHFFIGKAYGNVRDNKILYGLSGKYYSVYPLQALTPILFIAAGIFAVFITGANRMNFAGEFSNRSGGTGGYLLWCENAIHLKKNMNSVSDRKALGLNSDQLAEMSFVPAKRSSGNDASCLNLNHVSAPPLLGIDPADFISRGSFSFSRIMSGKQPDNPWQFLNKTSENSIIYGIADQTVLQWGLMLSPGDTLILRAENGQPLNIIIAAGLKSSIFQGNVLIGMENFTKYYPSVSGISVMLVDGDPDHIDLYKSALNERLGNNGINIELTTERLESFYEVTNTYLSVFGVFGALGMIIGIVGLGFVLLRNYNQRKREYALMLATGFTVRRIRRIIFTEQILILFAGITTGIISAIVATLPSVISSPYIPWMFLSVMIIAVTATGIVTLFVTVRGITVTSLMIDLKKE